MPLSLESNAGTAAIRTGPTLLGLRILIVENDPALAELLEQSLVTSRAHMTIVGDPEAALARVAADSFDVIYWNLAVAAPHELDVLRRLRHATLTPVLAVTRESAVETLVAAFAAGVDDVVRRPFAIEELKARLAALMRRRERELRDVIVVANLSLNVRTGEVFVGDAMIRLPPKEQQLLRLLMQTPGRPVPMPTLAQVVWQAPYEPSRRYAKAIGRLRQALRDAQIEIVWVTDATGARLKRSRAGSDPRRGGYEIREQKR
jgi:two-component system response regulator TctD